MSCNLSVTHVVLSLDCGGLEQVVLNLVREGGRLGQKNSVICVEQRGTLAPLVEQLGATVRCVHKRPGVRLSAVKNLRAAIDELAPDVVHTHQVGALFYAGPAARRAAVPLVVHTEHGKHYSVRRRTRWIGRLAGRYVQRFFCVSEDIAAEVRASRIVPSRKLCVVPNGIDTGRFRTMGDAEATRASLGIPLQAPVVGTVGRLSEIKRQHILLEAFARVHALIPDAHLLIVGDGPLMGELRHLAQKLKVDAAVHFAGYQQRPEAYLAAMDLFALTSRSEGMPLVVLEAWATGVPVVASAVGGLPAMIDHGRTGRLFPSGDIECLASELRHLLTNRLERQRLGEAGLREVTERYDVARMARTYHGHYQELLSGSHRFRKLAPPFTVPARNADCQIATLDSIRAG